MNNKKSKVYITLKEKRLDYSPAEMFGDLNFLTETQFIPESHSRINKNTMSDVKSNLVDFDPSKDFIVLVGHPIYMSIVSSMLARKSIDSGYDVLNFLTWDSRKSEYRECRVNTSSMCWGLKNEFPDIKILEKSS